MRNPENTHCGVSCRCVLGSCLARALVGGGGRVGIQAGVECRVPKAP